VSRVVLLGTTVWGTYGNIFSAHHWLVSETVVVDKRIPVGGGYLIFCNANMF
jgi:hypothetical protein